MDGVECECSTSLNEVHCSIVHEERDAGGIVASLAIGAYQSGHLVGTCGQSARNDVVDVAISKCAITTPCPVLDERSHHTGAVAVTLSRPCVHVEVAELRFAYPVEHAVVGHNASNDDGIVGNEFLSLIDSSLQRSDGSLQGLLVLLNIGGCVKSFVGHSGHSVVGILIGLQGLEFLTQLFNSSDERCKLHVLNITFSTIVGQREVIPDTPRVGTRATHTYCQIAVFNLHEDWINGVLASCKAV